MKKVFLAFTIFMLVGFAAYSANFKVTPEKYRSWHHVKSMVIFDEKHPLYNTFGGIHHIYVNNKGLNTIKKQSDRKFPDGTIITFVLYEHKTVDGAYVEGMKKIEAFMVKDSKKYKSTGGWGYYGYDSNGKNLVKDMVKDCHSCHSQAKNQDFVFSSWTK